MGNNTSNAEKVVSAMSDERKHQLKLTFQKFDVDADGYISRAELKDAMTVLDVNGYDDDETIDAIMTAADKNSDGRISYDEFMTIMACRGTGTMENAVVELLFSVFDHDKDGYLTIEEIKKTYKAAGGNITEDQIEQFIKLCDHNFDGRVSLEEFHNMFSLFVIKS